MACQQKPLDDLHKPMQYRGVVLTAVTSRKAIRSAIAEASMSQEQVAEAVNVSPITLSRWLNGHSDPSFEKLDALAHALGRPLVLTFGTRETPASLTRRVLAGVIALEGKAGVSQTDLSAALQEAERLEALALEADALLAGAVTPPRRKRGGQSRGRAGGQSAGSPGSKRQRR
jgi:transcriptional regulator with XRE-family HTH domain